MRSSYEKNNYADVFVAIIAAWRPLVCVELGVLDGYSTIAIAEGLKHNHKVPGITGHLDSYDIFEDYPYNHGNQADVQKSIEEAGVSEFVTLHKQDAYTAHNNYSDGAVHLLHVDLSNTGEIVRKIMELWNPKIQVGGIVLFEGGTEERDKEEWMVKYNKEPIKPEIEKNEIINSQYVYATYLKWPGLTSLLKKR